MDPRQNFLDEALESFRRQKALAEGAIRQLDDGQLHWVPDEDGNSVAILMQHLAGNMRSRWSNYLESDGEKAGRDRDGEFIDQGLGREALMELWEEGWRTLFEALAPLGPEDLGRSAPIRGRAHTVVDAVLRQMSHYAYHIGQLVQLARMQLGPRWETLSIKRGESGAYVPKGKQ